MGSHLFVYGTLMLSSGHSMGKKLASEAEFLGEASIPGELYDFGKWPGLVFSNASSGLVFGEVWKLRSPDSLAWLDAYEGIGPDIERPEYERIELPVSIDGGDAITAFVYVYRWPIDHSRLIPTGRWVPSSRRHFCPANPEPFQNQAFPL